MGVGWNEWSGAWRAQPALWWGWGVGMVEGMGVGGGGGGGLAPGVSDAFIALLLHMPCHFNNNLVLAVIFLIGSPVLKQ